jgi:hypothetical protein
MSVGRLAKVYLLEPDPNRDGIPVLYGVSVHITPDGDRELARRDPDALRTVVMGCRMVIAGWQERRAA